jgi:hypothetical protein
MRKLSVLIVLMVAGLAHAQYTPQSITTTSASTPSGCASIDVTSNKGAVGFYVGGTWTGTLTPEVAVQGQPSNSAAASYVIPSTSSTTQTTITADGVYFFPSSAIAGASTVYICGPTSTGTALIWLNSSTALNVPPGSSSTGTISDILPGTGISVSGGTGPTATITNTGVTSIFGQTGAITALVVSSGDSITTSGTGTNVATSCPGCTAGSVAFSGITSGTNSTAAMVLGTGSSLTPSGTGTVEANELAATVKTQTAGLTLSPLTGTTLNITGPLSMSILDSASDGLSMVDGTLNLFDASGANEITMDTTADGGIGMTFFVTAPSDVFFFEGGPMQFAGQTSGVVSMTIPAVAGTVTNPVVFSNELATPTPATATNSTIVATTAFVKAQGYAPLASPAFTGTPTAPTASSGDSSTQLATDAFVQNAIGASGAVAWAAITAGSNAQTGAFSTAAPWTHSYAGTASTPAINVTGAPFTGGTGTTTFPLVYINDGASPTTFSTAGTEFGINTPSGFTGNLIDAHVNGGASVFSVNYQGTIISGANIELGGGNILIFNAHSQVSSPANGSLLLTNSSASSFTALEFGGTTSSFASLQSSGTTLTVGAGGVNTNVGNLAVTGAIESVGTKFTASGCSNSTTVGGAIAGSFTSGTTGTCTVTITMGGASAVTAPNGWACYASDQTTPANLYDQKSGGSTTTAVLSGTTVSGDVISFGCMAY